MTTSEAHQAIRSQVKLTLGTASDLLNAFSFSPGVADKYPPVLKDAVEHAINQTLLRDCCYGSWAVVDHDSPWVWKDDDEYRVKIFSPNDDITRFESVLPLFLQAIQTGHDIYQAQQPALEAQRKKLVAEANAANPSRPVTEDDYQSWYLPPFGLSMVKTNSIQLLHYPPAETLTYMDYLYSPTNRRWESLLGYNRFPGARNTLVETIVDIAPIAASGGSRGGKLIEPLLENDVFKPYVQKMLPALLRPNVDGTMTQPIVAYGGPVGAWLQKNYGEELASQNVLIVTDKQSDGQDGPPRPQVCSVFTLHLCGEDGPATPVMCANHPIKFNYYDKDYAAAQGDDAPDHEAATKDADRAAAIVLSQDLTAAGWQSEMAARWETNRDPDLYRKIQQRKLKEWSVDAGRRFDEMLEIFRAQVEEFSLSPLLAVDTAEWEQMLRDSLADG